MTKFKYDATDINSLICLCKKISEKVENNYINKAEFLSKLHFSGLFNARGNFVLNSCLKIAYKMRGYKFATSYMTNCLVLMGSETVSILFEQFLYHVIYGKDTEQVSSVGGFSQIEIFMVMSIFDLF